MKGLILLEILVVCCSHFVIGDYGTFTSYVNLEKLYTLEDELIALTDVILSQERTLHGSDDVHNICNITSVVKSVKEIHRDIINNRNLIAYLSNPVHVFQLTRRLTKDWSKIVERLGDSEVCEKIMQLKIQNIKDNIPSEAQLSKVADAVLRIQIIYNISAEDLMTGQILGVQTDARLTGVDALEIARTAYANQRYLVASRWLQALVAKSETDASIDKISALNVLSSSYYKLGRPADAMAALDDLLKIDPGHASAKRNQQFIMESSKGKAEKEVKSSVAKTRQERRLMELCGDNVQPVRYGVWVGAYKTYSAEHEIVLKRLIGQILNFKNMIGRI